MARGRHDKKCVCVCVAHFWLKSFLGKRHISTLGDIYIYIFKGACRDLLACLVLGDIL